VLVAVPVPDPVPAAVTVVPGTDVVDPVPVPVPVGDAVTARVAVVEADRYPSRFVRSAPDRACPDRTWSPRSPSNGYAPAALYGLDVDAVAPENPPAATCTPSMRRSAFPPPMMMV
jgi:hypothetical protein